MANIANISKITIPVGNSTVTYNLYDEWVRGHMGATGVSFTIAWDGSSEPVVANIPAGVDVYYGVPAVKYTGTKTAASADSLGFYLVYSGSQIDGKDIYDEYVAVGPANSKSWEKIGDTAYDFSNIKALAYKDSITLLKGSGDTALGANATLQAQASSVTLKDGQSDANDSVLGASTTLVGESSSVTFTGGSVAHAMGTDPVITAADSSISWAGGNPIATSATVLGMDTSFTTTMTNATQKMSAEASGFSISSAGNEATVITGLTPAASSFVKGLSKPSKKMVTSTISTVDGEESVSVVDKTSKKMELAEVPHANSVGAADTWSFTYNSGTHTLAIAGANGGKPISLASTNDTVATGALLANGDTGYEDAGAEIVSTISIENKTVAKKAANDTTVATGALLDDATGASIITSVTHAAAGQTANALTGITPQTQSGVLTGVTCAQPGVALSLGTTGDVDVLTAVSNPTTTAVTAGAGSDVVTGIRTLSQATAGAQTISVDDADTTDVVVSAGNGVVAAQNIVITKDNVDAITGLGARSAAGQSISVNVADSKTVAKYGDLGIDIS